MTESDESVMTLQEVALFLRLSESTIYRLAQEGKLPGRKVGGAWRFSRKGLEAWLERTAGYSDSGSMVSNERTSST
jgi:excisionase family DNA binding protein